MSTSECVIFNKGDDRMFTNRLTRLFARATSALLFLILLNALFSATVLYSRPPPVLASGDFAGGSGTESDPYLVATAAHLNNVRNHLDAHFRQTADINLGLPPWNEGEGWQPIGGSGNPFTGSFDGGVYVIYNLTIDRPTAANQGLFGYLNGAAVNRAYLENAAVVGQNYTGGLTGRADNSVLDFIRLRGQAAGGTYTGGAVGYMQGGSFGQVAVDTAVQGGAYTGGR